uniref:Uncharacterized protein n=1 Tax=Acrobeloides nanus TaxID=290746 RepID=A0A914EPA2_9BILA
MRWFRSSQITRCGSDPAGSRRAGDPVSIQLYPDDLISIDLAPDLLVQIQPDPDRLVQNMTSCFRSRSDGPAAYRKNYAFLIIIM